MNRFWGKLFCINANAALGVRKRMIGNGVTSGRQTFSLQHMRYAIKRRKLIKLHMKAG